MTPELLRIVDRRLEATGALEHDWSLLVVGACEGADELDAALGGATATTRGGRRATKAAREAAAQQPSEAPGAFLESVTVEGFRGIGPKRTLTLEPGPGLTLVVGRNGSGKSSFAEAVEILLTGTNSRWAKRSKIWQEGWRNLHHHDRTAVEATFAIEGQKGMATVTRAWPEDAGLGDSTVTVRLPTKTKSDLTALGWTSSVEAFRPFLSYNELGSTFDDGPTEFHDRLSRILGLGEIEDALQLLRTARLARTRTVDEVKARLAALLAQLESVDDPRAKAAQKALKGKTWDLPAAERALDSSGSATDGATAEEIGLLRGLANLSIPDAVAVRQLAADLRDVASREAAVAATPAGEARDTIEILRIAVRHFDAHGEGDCPVCGKKLALLPSWRARSQARIDELTARAAAAEAVARDARDVRRRAAEVAFDPPASLARASELAGVDSFELQQAWSAFATAPADPPNSAALPDHLDESIDAVVAAGEAVRTAARAELDRREAAWTPVARALTAWLDSAPAALDAQRQVADLKDAEAWLKATSGEIRAERFEPIANSAIELWRLFRQQSNVDLESVVLTGTGTSRQVKIDVTIDGVPSAALGVMSQGELHAMALSLFLPRATLPESPFRFVVIDDPVQSMDPARVDGLARVLEDVARHRQVIVFTHDDRLPESTRRLRIDARVIEVTRRENSVVELSTSVDPTERNLDDAEAIALDADVPPELARQVVPGYCRAAIEAAAIEIVRRRRIERGESHGSVEQLLESNDQLRKLLALALFDNAGKHNEVDTKIGGWGLWASEVFSMANRGAHTGSGLMPLDELVPNTRKFCRLLHERSPK